MKFTFLNLGTKRPMTYFQKKKIVKKNMNKKIMIKKSQNYYPCDFPRIDENSKVKQNCVCDVVTYTI